VFGVIASASMHTVQWWLVSCVSH